MKKTIAILRLSRIEKNTNTHQIRSRLPKLNDSYFMSERQYALVCIVNKIVLKMNCKNSRLRIMRYKINLANDWRIIAVSLINEGVAGGGIIQD